MLKLLTTPIAIATLTIATQFPAHSKPAPLGKKCALVNSTYQAIGLPDYQIIFSPPPPKGPNMDAIVTFKHPKRGTINTFRMVTANGYGSQSLSDIKNDSAESLKIVFFDNDLNQYTIPKNNAAAEYLFVSGLGVADHYSMKEDSRKYPLRDRMWKFQKCN